MKINNKRLGFILFTSILYLCTLFLFAHPVHAESLSINSGQINWGVATEGAMNDNGTCAKEPSYWSPYQNRAVIYSFSPYILGVSMINVRLTVGTPLQAGTTYTLKFAIAQASKSNFSSVSYSLPAVDVSANIDGSSSHQLGTTNWGSWGVHNDTSSDYNWSFTFTFIPDGDTRFIEVHLRTHGDYSCTFMNPGTDAQLISYSIDSGGETAGLFATLTANLSNFFTNLGTMLLNGLTSLFVPSNNFFTDYFNQTKSDFSAKAGILYLPFDILDTFNTFVQNISSSDYVIHISQINDPIFNQPIITAQDFDLSQTFTTGAIGTIHDIYLYFVDTLLILAFIRFCYNEFYKIVGGLAVNV